MLMKLKGGKLCKEVTCYDWMFGFANVLHQIEMTVIAMEMCVNVFGLHHMIVHNIITGVIPQTSRLYQKLRSNTGCFEVGPAVVSCIAILKRPQQGHRSNVSLSSVEVWMILRNVIYFAVCMPFLAQGAWSDNAKNLYWFEAMMRDHWYRSWRYMPWVFYTRELWVSGNNIYYAFTNLAWPEPVVNNIDCGITHWTQFIAFSG